jgi:hypothetical protein
MASLTSSKGIELSSEIGKSKLDQSELQAELEDVRMERSQLL